MTRLKEVIPPRRLAEASSEVTEYTRRLGSLGVEPTTREAAVELYVETVMPRFERQGNLIVSQKAGAIITKAQQVGLDPIPTVIAAAEAAISEGRRKIGNCGRAKEPLTNLANKLTKVLFERKHNGGERRDQEGPRYSPPPTVTPNQEYAKKQRDRVVAAAEMLAKGIPLNQALEALNKK